MTGHSTSRYRHAWLRGIAASLISLVAACGTEAVAPTAGAVLPDSPADTAITAADTATPPPTDSTTIGSAAVVLDPRSKAPGIVFGSFNLDAPVLSSTHDGTLRGGGLSAANLLPLLAQIQAKGGRVVLKLCNGRDSFVKNPDGTFSFTKWKALVDRFKGLNLDPYINDGTIVGHFLIDEPHRIGRWGGKIISQATIEAMAQYSKQWWPGMTTFVRVVPSWLATAPVTYTYLDAGWVQYGSGKGPVGPWIASEVAAAQRLGVGLAVGLNVLDGGDGSSKIPGTIPGGHAMSASELTSYGTAVLAQSYSCAFYMWTYSPSYYQRADVKSAMLALSNRAHAHAKTSCQQ